MVEHTDELKTGQRVVMTAEAIAQGLNSGRDKSLTGVIVAHHPLAPNLIKVRRDNRKTANIYHVKFWNPIEGDKH
jgi:hypothetical protein